MSTRQITRCGLAVALLALGASVTLAVGPVPFTLQTLVLALLPIAIGGREAVCAVAVYLLLGTMGLPVFSGFSGGLSHLVGPTGGFLWGFLVGTMSAALIQRASFLPEHVRDVAGAVSMLLLSYLFGVVQLVLMLGLDPAGAFAVAVAPFVVPDAVKLCVGVACGRAVRRALGSRAEGQTAL